MKYLWWTGLILHPVSFFLFFFVHGISMFQCQSSVSVCNIQYSICKICKFPGQFPNVFPQKNKKNKTIALVVLEKGSGKTPVDTCFHSSDSPNQVVYVPKAKPNFNQRSKMVAFWNADLWWVWEGTDGYCCPVCSGIRSENASIRQPLIWGLRK